MINYRKVIALAVLVIFLCSAGVGSAEVVGRPDIDVTIPDNRIVPGTNTTLHLSVTNGGRLEEGSVSDPQLNDRVLAARSVGIAIRDTSIPISVKTGSQRIGIIGEGDAKSLSFRVLVDEDAEPGSYRLPVSVTYTHTRSINEVTGDVATVRVRKTFRIPIVVESRAQFRVTNTTGVIGPGRTGPVSVTVVNTGSETARDTVMRLESRTGGVTIETVQSAGRYLGTVPPGAHRTLTYQVSATQAVAEANYPLALSATFRDLQNRSRTSNTIQLGIEPKRGRQFVFTDVTSSVTVDGTGTASVTIQNNGQTAQNVEILVTAPHDAVLLDGATASRRMIAGWPAMTNQTFKFEVTPVHRLAAGEYPLNTVITYETTDGVDVTTRANPIGMPIRPGPSFGLTDLETDLAVGEEGTIRGALINHGSSMARDTVVVISSESPTLDIRERTFAGGNLSRGETLPFAFDVAVDSSATGGPRSVNISVRHRTIGDTRRVSDPLVGRVQIAPPRDRLRFRAVNTTMEIDTSNRLSIEVSNIGNDTLYDLTLAITVHRPLTSESPTVFVDQLAPGASSNIGFELTVSEDAVESTQAIRINASAETATGDVIQIEPESVGIATVEPGGPGSDVILVGGGAALVVLLFISGWWWLRQ